MARALGLVDRRLLQRMAVWLAGTLWLHGHATCQTIVIDQLGYRPNDPKIAFVRQAGGGNFEVKDVATNKTVSTAFFLYLYEGQPGKFTDGQLAIPESRNGVPDILDEARWALEWLLKLQRDDGGVYHKVSIKTWTGEHLPDKESDRQYIFDVSSASTADVAAVTALGARLFKKVDPQFAVALLKCATNAWKFLNGHRDIVPPGGFRNPQDVEGGEYGDQNDLDE